MAVVSTKLTRRSFVHAAGLLLTGLSASSAFAQTSNIGPSGLPLPRFVSLKSDRVNVRIGPSQEYDVSWTFVKAGLPVEIIQEYVNWRRIRDWEGKEGWVFHSLLSSRRTALVTPWEKKDTITNLKEGPDNSSGLVAKLQSDVLLTIESCDGKWCKAKTKDIEGWVEQSKLFGVYPNEKITE